MTAENNGGGGINDRDVYLTRREVARRLNITEAKLRGYTDVDTAYFGGVQGVKGIVYPQSSLPRFTQVMNRLTPYKFREFINNTRDVTPGAQGTQSAPGADVVVADVAAVVLSPDSSEAALAPQPQQQQDISKRGEEFPSKKFDDFPTGGGLELLAGSVGEIAREMAAARLQREQEAAAERERRRREENRLVSQDEAAQMLLCKRPAVSRFVKPFRPGVWRLSDILDYINGDGKDSSSTATPQKQHDN